MRPKQLIKLIEKGESSTLEFKRKITTPKKLAKEFSALANTKGGYLLVGVDDDGTIIGIHSEKSDQDQIEQSCQFHIDPPIEPAIEFVNVYDKEVAVVYIEESHNKPHNIFIQNGKDTLKRAYIRMGEKSVEASREMHRLMRYSGSGKPVKLSIGDKEKRLFTYLEKKERATVKDFAKLVNISDRRAERLMIRLVRAGVLMIHNDLSHDYFTLP
jgi:predicted HTH transcriptional regulator